MTDSRPLHGYHIGLAILATLVLFAPTVMPQTKIAVAVSGAFVLVSVLFLGISLLHLVNGWRRLLMVADGGLVAGAAAVLYAVIADGAWTSTDLAARTAIGCLLVAVIVVGFVGVRTAQASIADRYWPTGSAEPGRLKSISGITAVMPRAGSKRAKRGKVGRSSSPGFTPKWRPSSST